MPFPLDRRERGYIFPFFICFTILVNLSFTILVRVRPFWLDLSGLVSLGGFRPVQSGGFRLLRR